MIKELKEYLNADNVKNKTDAYINLRDTIRYDIDKFFELEKEVNDLILIDEDEINLNILIDEVTSIHHLTFVIQNLQQDEIHKDKVMEFRSYIRLCEKYDNESVIDMFFLFLLDNSNYLDLLQLYIDIYRYSDERLFYTLIELHSSATWEVYNSFQDLINKKPKRQILKN